MPASGGSGEGDSVESDDSPADPADEPDAPDDDTASPTAAPDTAPPTVPVEALPDPRCGDDIEPSKPVTLTVWHGLTRDADAFIIEAVGRFQAEHPNISIEVTRPASDYPAALDVLGDPDLEGRPDVITGTNETVRPQADSGLFVSVEECGGWETPAQFTDLLPIIDRTYRVDGVLWGAPYNVSAPVLMFDANLWRDVGLDPNDPPSTLDEMIEAARTLRDSGQATTGMVLYDRSAQWLITEIAAKAGANLIEPDNGHDIELPTSVSLATPANIDRLQQFADLKNEGYIYWAGLNANAEEDLTQLIVPTERSGMTLHTSASLGDVFRLLDNGALPDVEVAVAPFPGPAPGSTIGGGAWWMVDSADPDRIAAAWQFVRWMSEPEQIASLAAFTGYIPTTLRAAEHPIMLERWESHPQFKVAYDQVAGMPGSPASAGIQVGPMVETFRTIEIAAAFSIDAGSDPEAQLRAAEENILGLMQAYHAADS